MKLDKTVWATGWNEYGQLGDGTTVDKTNYIQVVKGGANAVAAGRRHSMMLKQDGSVWATGDNIYGQLGGASTTMSTVFVQVIWDSAQALAVGGFHSMVIKRDGSIWATGHNQFGQFGDGSTKSVKAFVALSQFDTGKGRGTITHLWLHCHYCPIAGACHNISHVLNLSF